MNNYVSINKLVFNGSKNMTSQICVIITILITVHYINWVTEGKKMLTVGMW